MGVHGQSSRLLARLGVCAVAGALGAPALAAGAGTGWDSPTGLGRPNVAGLIASLAPGATTGS